MAIFHLHAKIISRAAGVGRNSSGRSAVAAAAYRSAERLADHRIGKTFDYTKKGRVESADILAPEGSPSWVYDRQTLWNAVELAERRKDSQLSREIELALPIELSNDEKKNLVHSFVIERFVTKGMVADVAVHDVDGRNPHAHIMLTTRPLSEDGFLNKNRDWNKRAELLSWRAEWANAANLALQNAGHNVRISHESYKGQGIKLKPGRKLGFRFDGIAELRRRFIDKDKAEVHESGLRSNGDQILQNPEAALDALSVQRATFTKQDLAKWLFSHVDTERYQSVLSACLSSDACIRLGLDSNGHERFTTWATLARESLLIENAEKLAQRCAHPVPMDLAAKYSGSRQFGVEQELAYRYLTVESGDVAVVQGHAGSGKSYVLGAAKEAWEGAGNRVLGAALAGRAAEGLESESGIASRTIASWEFAWARGRDLLSERDVFVIDEAGMVDTAQLRRVLNAVEQAGAKAVLVGDTEQLQAIGAGDGMRLVAERVGQVVISEVRRQREAWMASATMDFATGKTIEALLRYEKNGHIVEAESKAAAAEALLERWSRESLGQGSSLILAYRRIDVAMLNGSARELAQEAGVLGKARSYQCDGGTREFAVGDRVIFGKNDRGLGVNNGTLGTVVGVHAGRMKVMPDGADASVEVDFSRYRHVDYGYAATIHKSQGATVDRVYVMASKMMDRHASYVAMSRHREEAFLYFDSQEFRDRTELFEALARKSERHNAHDFSVAKDVLDAESGSADEPKVTYEALNDAQLKEREAELVKQSAGDIVPPSSERSAAVDAAVAALRARDEQASIAKEVWGDYEKEHPALAVVAKAGVGQGAALWRALQGAQGGRELAVQRVLEARAERDADGSAALDTQRRHREIRAARDELALVKQESKVRRVRELQVRLDTVELEQGAAVVKLLELDAQGEPRGTEAAKRIWREAYQGAEDEERGLERRASGLRWDISREHPELRVAHRAAQDGIPEGLEEARNVLPAAKAEMGRLLKSWLSAAETDSRDVVHAARLGEGGLSECYGLYLQQRKRCTATERVIAEHLQARNSVELEARLDGSEARFASALTQWREFQKLHPEEARLARVGSGAGAKLYSDMRSVESELRKNLWVHHKRHGTVEIRGKALAWREPASDLIENEGRRKQALAAIGEAGRSRDEALAAWESYKQDHAPGEVAPARKGGALIYLGYRQALEDYKVAAAALGGVLKEGAEIRGRELEAKLDRAEGRFADCLKAWRELEETAPAVAKDARLGRGEGAKLFATMRDVETDLTARQSAHAELHAGVIKGRALSWEAPAKSLPEAQVRLKQAQEASRSAREQRSAGVAAWSAFKRAATPTAVMSARRGNEADGAVIYQGYRQGIEDCRASMEAHGQALKARAQMQRKQGRDGSRER